MLGTHNDLCITEETGGKARHKLLFFKKKKKKRVAYDLSMTCGSCLVVILTSMRLNSANEIIIEKVKNKNCIVLW